MITRKSRRCRASGGKVGRQVHFREAGKPPKHLPHFLPSFTGAIPLPTSCGTILCPESSLLQRRICLMEVCDRHCFPVPQTVFSFGALGLCHAIRIFSKITVPPSNQLFLLFVFFFCFLSLSPLLPILLASDWAAARTLARGRTAKWQGAEGGRRKGRVNDRSRDYSLGYTLNLPLTICHPRTLAEQLGRLFPLY